MNTYNFMVAGIICSIICWVFLLGLLIKKTIEYGVIARMWSTIKKNPGNTTTIIGLWTGLAGLVCWIVSTPKGPDIIGRPHLFQIAMGLFAFTVPSSLALYYFLRFIISREKQIKLPEARIRTD